MLITTTAVVSAKVRVKVQQLPIIQAFVDRHLLYFQSNTILIVPTAVRLTTLTLKELFTETEQVKVTLPDTTALKVKASKISNQKTSLVQIQHLQQMQMQMQMQTMTKYPPCFTITTRNNKPR